MQLVRGRLLLVVDPSRDLAFAPLEAAMVADAARAMQIERLDGDRLAGAELAAACGRADVLHLVGHGRFDDASPYRSGIAIGPLDDADAFWSNADVFGEVEAPAARLAVLSGCETGRSRPNLVSEEVSLPAAFIAAGYAAVIGSRWAVDDLSTTLLMADFHRRWLAGGISVAGALGASRRWLRDLDRAATTSLVATMGHTAAAALPSLAGDCRRLCDEALRLLAQEGERPFDHPYYWGAFFVAGDGAISADGGDRRLPP
jgi:CHAT domain-containing protein